MITIEIDDSHAEEKKYIIHVIFKELLGVSYKIKTTGNPDYKIILDNNKSITFKNHFFTGSLIDYLDKKNIPARCKFIKNRFLKEQDIPVIYGNDELKVSKNNITCGIDIFSSSFYMLTRWEEYIDKDKDIYSRSKACNCLAYKNNFLDRPVVNEYAEMLYNMMIYLGADLNKKRNNFNVYITHDVDHPLYCKRGLLKTFAADLIKRKSLKLGLKSINNILLSRKNTDFDPFNTFDFLMNYSEKIGCKSYFFFMGNKKSTDYDTGYSLDDKFIQQIFNEITDRRHFIGFHPGYYTYDNSTEWHKQYEYIADHSPQKIISGRQHYLRFEVPTTWQIWEDNGMNWESSLYYSGEPGFRCGICTGFTVFNFLTKKMLKLKEMPLLLMENTLYKKFNGNIISIKKYCLNLIDMVKSYNGDFVMLWHNSSFNLPQWQNARELFTDIINYLGK